MVYASRAMLTEREELTAYEKKLARSEGLIAEAVAKRDEANAAIERETPTVEHLRLIVTGMRGLLGIGSDPETSADDADDGDGNAPSDHGTRRVPGASKMTYGGLPSIPAVILEVLGPYDASLDAIYRAVCAHPTYADRKQPSRGSVNNRLNEMAERREIIKARTGVYRSLPRSGGAENPDERGQADQPDDLPSQIAASIAANGTDHKLAPKTVTAGMGAGEEMRLEVGSR
jgi:hypothetical protein